MSSVQAVFPDRVKEELVGLCSGLSLQHNDWTILLQRNLDVFGRHLTLPRST